MYNLWTWLIQLVNLTYSTSFYLIRSFIIRVSKAFVNCYRLHLTIILRYKTIWTYILESRSIIIISLIFTVSSVDKHIKWSAYQWMLSISMHKILYNEYSTSFEYLIIMYSNRHRDSKFARKLMKLSWSSSIRNTYKYKYKVKLRLNTN